MRAAVYVVQGELEAGDLPVTVGSSPCWNPARPSRCAPPATRGSCCWGAALSHGAAHLVEFRRLVQERTTAPNNRWDQRQFPRPG